MKDNEMMLSIGLVTLLLLILLGFLLFILLWQRARNNRFIMEKEVMHIKFNEQLFKSQLEIQEQTFDLISMEIHDNVGQTLSLLKVQLNIMDQRETFEKSLVTEIKNNVGKAMADLRDIAKSMSTERISHSTLTELTKNELDRLERTGIIAVKMLVSGNEQNIQKDKKLILFRIIQESLQNIIKHSKATEVSINFVYETAFLIIEIVDNGIGFENCLVESNKTGLGIKNMQSRTAIIGGNVAINSKMGYGTTITIKAPYE